MPGRGHDCADTQLEIRDRLAEQVARRIAGARVVVTALVAEAAEREGRSQVDRRHHRSGVIVTFEARAHRVGDLVGGMAACQFGHGSVALQRRGEYAAKLL